MPNKLDRANDEERKAIISFLAAAKTLVPALKVRFLERLPDQEQPFVRIGLALPAGMTATSGEAYELHQLASDISDTLPCHVSVSTSPITGGNALVSMEGIVEQESMSLDAVNALPIRQRNYGRKVSNQALAIGLVAFCMLLGLMRLMSYLGKGVSDGNSPVPTAVGTESPEKALESKRREFVRALDDYMQSLLQQPGHNDPAVTKRLGTLKAIRDLVSNDSCFSGSGSTQEKQQK